MLGLRYGSEDAAAQTEAWMHAIARAAYLASVDLARRRAPSRCSTPRGTSPAATWPRWTTDVRAAIREHGIRNALLTSIAPTGTISLYAGNVSSGIEPVFAYAYTRKVLQKDGSRTEEEVVDYAVQLWRDSYRRRPPARHFRQRPDAGAARPCADAGGGAEMDRLVDLQDDQLPRGHHLRGLQGGLHGGLGSGLQGLHHLPAERRDGRRSWRSSDDQPTPRPRPTCGGRRRLPVRAARPAAGAGRRIPTS